ncbi:MAG: CGNR zinc finger domain-containing protein [Bacteroidales bacterium]|nr:CGNR zinc finger domain-containing protein [Bacteroidales bacterium]
MDKSRFHFENYACDLIQEQRFNVETGLLQPSYLIRVNPSKSIRTAYIPGEGLQVVGEKEIASKNNILGEFLALKKDDSTSYKDFFSKYGFLFPIDAGDEYQRISIKQIDALKNRLFAFVLLVNNQYFDQNAIEKNKRNFEELLNASLFLLLTSAPKVMVEDEVIFEVEENSLMKVLNGVTGYDEQPQDFIEEADGFKRPAYRATIVIEEENYIYLSNDEYLKYVSEENQVPQWCKNVYRIFINKDNFTDNEEVKFAVDFLFYFIRKYTPFDFSESYPIADFTNDIYEQLNEDEIMKKALIKLSKYIIKSEFERNLKDVTPIYDVENMSPNWKLPSLFSALYFSLFYLDANESMYRQCSNVYCGQYFEVPKTNRRKKYCCAACGNAANQRRYKSRKNQK